MEGRLSFQVSSSLWPFGPSSPSYSFFENEKDVQKPAWHHERSFGTFGAVSFLVAPGQAFKRTSLPMELLPGVASFCLGCH